MVIKDIQELMMILEDIKSSIVDDKYEIEKESAINLAIIIIKEWSNYLDFVGKRNAIENTVDFIYDDGNVDYNRLAELVKADKENRLVVFQPEYSVAKIYCPKDEGGLYAMKATGIVSEEEYLKHLEEENENHAN